MNFVDTILRRNDDDPVPTLDARGDDVLDLIANRRRRYVIRRVDRCDPDDPMDLSDLAVELAGAEGAPEGDPKHERVRKRTYVSLYQVHLPTLDEEGIVDYDNEHGTIAPTDLTEPAAQAVTTTERAIARVTGGVSRHERPRHA